MHDPEDTFFDVTRSAVSTGEGQVELPICYYDASHYMAIFQVKADRAEEKLADVPLQPAIAARKAIAVLSFFKYRDTSIGPYHEVGLALLVVPEGADPAISSISALPKKSRDGTLGSHVLDLPVTTRAADAAGREIWGYPKFVADLPIERDGKRFDGRVIDSAGELIMGLQGECGISLGDDIPSMDVLTYTMHDGEILRTHVRTRYRCETSGGGSLKLSVGDSTHRMAENARDLGLDGRSPKLWQTTENFQSVLPAGEFLSTPRES